MGGVFMDLPKNITQIGETNPHCKIYVEDYVISYIKQLNQYARDKAMAVALYGIQKEEDGVTYLFLYGACKLNFLLKESRHLSQAVQQEIERQRVKYFSEYAFLGYRLLDGEMVDSFYICEQNVCRSIEGYAQFYEKNDRMLAFMLEERQEEAKPEIVDQEKYDVVKKRQEERRANVEAKGGHAPRPEKKAPQKEKAATVPGNGRLQNMKLTAAAAFVLLGVAGVAAMGSEGRLGDLQTAARQMVEDISEKQLPDVTEAVNSASVRVGTIVAEDKLTDAILKENERASASSQTSAEQEAAQGDSFGEGEAAPELTQPTQPPISEQEEGSSEPPAQESAEPVVEPSPEPTPEVTPIPDPTPQPTPEPVSYTIRRGDTLIGICMTKYGSDERVAEICELNQISNPDDIKEGETILLP